MGMEAIKSKNFWKSLGCLLLGSAVYALGYQLFMAPADVIIGGATGIAAVAHILFGFPVGLGVVLVNLPLLLWSVAKKGVRSVMYALPGILLTSVFLDAFSFLPMIHTDPFFSAAVGGALSGLGIGIMLARGFTTGGSELAATLLHERFSYITVGNFVLILDSAIISGAALVMGQIDVLFYSFVVSLAFALVLDLVVGGAERGKLAFIVTEEREAIVAAIKDTMGRRVTVIGSSDGREVLLSAVRRRELYRVKEIVRQKDPGAFLVITNAEEILGKGFMRMTPSSSQREK